MIVTRTPLRISLVGGGTDLSSFYKRHGGAVISMAISKYIYISLNEKFDDRIRLSYSRTENVDKASQLKHDIARSCLEGITGVEVTSVSDIPGEGSGLGSSSSFTVGLVNAIKHMPSAHTLAEVAYLVELGCGHPVGKQDFYAAAYGGFAYYQFNRDGTVCVIPLLTPEQRKEIQKYFLLFWTGKTRKASKILKQQSVNVSENGNAEFAASDMRETATMMLRSLQAGDIAYTGAYLDANWELKKKLAPGITSPQIDEWYDLGMNAGATGGKLCGAGGGGFLLFFAEPKWHESIKRAVGLRHIPFKIEEKGSEVIYGSR